MNELSTKEGELVHPDDVGSYYQAEDLAQVLVIWPK